MNSTKAQISASGLVLLVLLSLSGCNKRPVISPGKQIAPILTSVFGLNDYYQISPYPVDNFGVFTAYSAPRGQLWDEGNQICATWSCLGIETNEIPNDPSQRTTINGFADIGSGGTITLTDDQQNSFGVNLLLPGLAKLIDIKGGVDWKNHVNVKLRLGNTHKRTLNRIKALNYIRNVLKPGNPLRDAFDKGELVIVVADLLVDSVDATISIDKNVNGSADAALSQAAQSQQLLVGKDSSLRAKIESKGTGEYHLEVNNPVVLAVLPKQQPSGGTLGQSTDKDPWGDWKPVRQVLHRLLN